MPLTLQQTQERISFYADNCRDTELRIKLRGLSIDLLNQLPLNDKKQEHKWDFKSILLGALFASGLTLLLTPQLAQAATQKDAIVVNLTSIHTDTTYNYNTKNWGLGYLKNINRHLELEGGFYENSYNKQSLYALANLKHEMYGWNWGVAFGFVTGYDDIESKSKPMQSRLPNEQKSSSEREQHGEEHDEDGSKYKIRDSSHSHPKNLNAIQFLVMPNVTWKITKTHELNLVAMPSFSKSAVEFVGLKYRWRI